MARARHQAFEGDVDRLFPGKGVSGEVFPREPIADAPSPELGEGARAVGSDVGKVVLAREVFGACIGDFIKARIAKKRGEPCHLPGAVHSFEEGISELGNRFARSFGFDPVWECSYRLTNLEGGLCRDNRRGRR